MGLGVLLTDWLCWSLVALCSESSFRGCQETPNCLVFSSAAAFFLPTDFCKLCLVFLPVMTTPQSGFWLFACTGLPASQPLLIEAWCLPSTHLDLEPSAGQTQQVAYLDPHPSLCALAPGASPGCLLGSGPLRPAVS